MNTKLKNFKTQKIWAITYLSFSMRSYEAWDETVQNSVCEIRHHTTTDGMRGAERFDNHPYTSSVTYHLWRCFSYRWEARPYCLAHVSEPLQPVKTELPWCRLKVPPFLPLSLFDLDVCVCVCVCAHAFMWIWTVRVWICTGWSCLIHRRFWLRAKTFCPESPGTFYIFCEPRLFCSDCREETWEVDPTRGREKESGGRTN